MVYVREKVRLELIRDLCSEWDFYDGADYTQYVLLLPFSFT
jgi:hypothetical protein